MIAKLFYNSNNYCMVYGTYTYSEWGYGVIFSSLDVGFLYPPDSWSGCLVGVPGLGQYLCFSNTFGFGPENVGYIPNEIAI